MVEDETTSPGPTPAGPGSALAAFLATSPRACPTCARSLDGVEGDTCPTCETHLFRETLPCPLCGYNLRGLAGHHCPECGHRLVLGVRLAEPRQGAFLAGLVGIAASLGFCSLLLAWAGYMSLQPFGGPSPGQLLPLVGGTLVGGALLWSWLRGRSRLMRMEAGRRWPRVVMVTATALACPVWFILTVR